MHGEKWWLLFTMAKIAKATLITLKPYPQNQAGKEGYKYYLPILPIIYGGDDLTRFVTGGWVFLSRDIYLRF